MGLQEDFLKGVKAAQDRVTSNLNLLGQGVTQNFSSPQAFGQSVYGNRNALGALGLGTLGLMGGATLAAPYLAGAGLIEAAPTAAAATQLPKIAQDVVPKVEQVLPKIPEQLPADITQTAEAQVPRPGAPQNIINEFTKNLGKTNLPQVLPETPTEIGQVLPKGAEEAATKGAPLLDQLFPQWRGALRIGSGLGLLGWGINALGPLGNYIGAAVNSTMPTTPTDLGKYPQALRGHLTPEQIDGLVSQTGYGLGKLQNTPITADVYQKLSNMPLYQSEPYKTMLNDAMEQTKKNTIGRMTVPVDANGNSDFMAKAPPAYDALSSLRNADLSSIHNVWNTSEGIRNYNGQISDANNPVARDLAMIHQINDNFLTLYTLKNPGANAKTIPDWTLNPGDSPDRLRQKLASQLDFIGWNYTYNQPFYDATHVSTTPVSEVQVGNLPGFSSTGQATGLMPAIPQAQ